MRIVGREGKDQDPWAKPPLWSGTFIVPEDACEACRRHEHFRCVGGDPTRDPLEDCACSCGLRTDQLRLNREAWDDMARHVPWLIWMAVERERLLVEGPYLLRRHERGSRLRRYVSPYADETGRLP